MIEYRRTCPLPFVIAMSLAAINAVADTSGTLTITSNTTLAENQNGSIWIEADNVTLDCAGHTITGPGELPYNSGVLVLSHSGVTVKNCLVTGFEQGIQVADSVGVTVANNKSFDNPGNGYFVIRSIGTTLRGNSARGNTVNGVAISESQGSRVDDNRLEENESSGIGLVNSTGSVGKGNESVSNGIGLLLWGSSDNSFDANWIDKSAVYGIYLVQTPEPGSNTSSRNTFVRNRVRGSVAEGFLLLQGSDGNVLRKNTITFSGGGGLTLVGSSANSISANRVMQNEAGGISLLEGSNSNVVFKNLACRNGNVDANDDETGVGNTWKANVFCTSSLPATFAP